MCGNENESDSHAPIERFFFDAALEWRTAGNIFIVLKWCCDSSELLFVFIGVVYSIHSMVSVYSAADISGSVAEFRDVVRLLYFANIQ